MKIFLHEISHTKVSLHENFQIYSTRLQHIVFYGITGWQRIHQITFYFWLVVDISEVEGQHLTSSYDVFLQPPLAQKKFVFVNQYTEILYVTINANQFIYQVTICTSSLTTTVLVSFFTFTHTGTSKHPPLPVLARYCISRD